MHNNASLGDEPGLRANHTQGADHLNQPVPASAPASTSDDPVAARTHPLLKPIQPSLQTHGYGDSGINKQSHIHPQLRASSIGLPASDTMQRGASPPSDEAGQVSTSPVAGMAAQGILGHDPDDSMADGRKAKRELSQSKRAAQNRAAQRAFRQRKEHYIKKLEQQVREYAEMEQSYKAIQNDNYALREYVIQLQSRLLDLQVELPQPPPNVNIPPPTSAAGAARSAHPSATTEPGPSSTAAGTLADVAAAVAGLRAREPSADGMYSKSAYKTEPTEDSQTAEEIRRQLQQEGGLPPPSSMRA
ncbi:hypothetical protein F4779DRAFT_642486 [Xylariaceae sp. FL0662B]|nr:hypothetical protein F4779DRAFT_642486 [Xylariaceae sp. FL0662B]